MSGPAAPALERPASPTGRGALPFPLRAAILPALAVLALVVGSAMHLVAATDPWAPLAMRSALVLLGAPVVFGTVRGMLHGEFAADVVATLAIVTAALIPDQAFAGLVIVLMQTGGELLDAYAEGRASDAVRELEAAAPRLAHRLHGATVADGVTDVAAEAITVGDRLLVRPGEMVPCDGEVVEGSSSLDTSRITGEPLPERVSAGAHVRSGVVNTSSPLVVRVTAPARDSLYARIVELVRSAQGEKSPIQRLADRWAVWFTPVTLAACALAWLASHDPARVLAVLVVATPCPLLLATPVAVIGGINRAARRQVIVRNGAALELLARVDTVVFDKTGTLTHGRPAVTAVEGLDGADAAAILCAAAAVEMGSGHLLARSVMAEAAARGLEVPSASEIVEQAGRGVTGLVQGAQVSVGNRALVIDAHPAARATLEAHRPNGNGGLRAYVAIEAPDGRVTTGVITFGDRMRADLRPFFTRLGALGLTRTVLLSGDHTENVRPVAEALGITDARGDLLPDGKVAVVKALEADGRRVLMVGDGTNDAPALSAATVGIALAAHGGGISAEAAGVVLLADDVTRVEDAVVIGKRAVRIARQSIVWGLGLSAAAMVIAAFGLIRPTAGALIQEAIDVAVILNALRAARPHAGSGAPA
ncbi:MAG: hypothetical protein RL139_1099 [Gemmatimonadota bacterium]